MTYEEILKYYNAKAVYLTGSSTIMQGHDIDLVVYFDTKEEMLEALKHKLSYKECGYDLHFDYQISFNVHSFKLHYMKKLAGKDIKINIDIFSRQQEYMVLLDNYYRYLVRFHCKDLYNILWACYVLNNGNYDLNDEQIDNIKAVHDNKCLTKEQKQFIKNVLHK